MIDDRPTGVFDGVGSSQAAVQVRATFRARGTRRRRLWTVLSAVALVLIGGGIATGVTLRHLEHQYGPLQGGSFWGMYRPHGFVWTKSDDWFRLAPDPNAAGQVIASLDNLGAHSVRVTSIETNSIATKFEWSVYRVVPGSSVDGIRTPWRSFPAVIPAHGTIRLLITIHHPDDCSQYPNNDERYGGDHWVNWDSLLHSHRTFLEIGDSGGDTSIEVC